MKRIATIGLVLGLFALPATASDRPDRSQRIDRDDRDTDFERRDRFDRLERVQILAHRLERATIALREQASDHGHRHDPRRAAVHAALHRLEYAAGHFHRAVEHIQGPLHLESDLRKLTYAFRYAQWRAHARHAPRSVERRFDRVEDLMRDLRVAYFDAARGGHAERYAHARYTSPFRWFVASARWR